MFYNLRHIEEDLTGMHVNHKKVSEMSDEEKSFYYFKIHDTDGNDSLDGLEMIKAAIHRHGNFELQDELTHVTSNQEKLFPGIESSKFSFQVLWMSFLSLQIQITTGISITQSTFKL